MTPSDINKRLFSLLEEKCKLKTVKEMLQDGADPNYQQRGESLLSVAIDRYETLSVAKHLLKLGAVVSGNEIVKSVQSLPKVMLLLSHGGKINARSKNGYTILHASILEEVTNEEEQQYIDQPRVKRLEALISLGADPLTPDQNRLLPYDYALLQGKAEEIEFLQAAANARRSELDQQGEDGRTPLMQAVARGDLAEVSNLLSRGANTDILDKQLHSALSLAIKGDRGDISEILVTHGAEYSKAIKIKTAPQLLKAIERGLLGNVRLALQGGMPPPSINQIIEFDQPRFIPLLLQYGATYLGIEKIIQATSDHSLFSSLLLQYGATYPGVGEIINTRHKHATRELLTPLMSKQEHIDLGEGWQASMKKAEEVVCLARAIKEKYPDAPWMRNYVDDDIEWAGPAWNLRILVVPASMVDRRKSMLAGPFFTSEDYPWPKSLNKSAPDKYASPVVQIDLGAISKLRNMAFGDGTLQVFDGSGGSIIRVIPKQVMETAVMTPVAPMSEADLYYPTVPTGWLTGGQVEHIIGYEGPVFSCHVAEEDAFDEEDEEDEDAFDDSPSEVKKLAGLMKKIGCQNDSGLHLFGTFYPVQYRAAEKGIPVFLSLDCDHGYFWGDSGTAQVFYKMTDEGPEFSFAWSCY